MKFRAGDIVSVQGTVKHNIDPGDLTVAVDIFGHHAVVWAELPSVKMVKQKIVIGDMIKFDAPAECTALYLPGRVLAISDDHAWIDLGGGDYCTRTLSSIERDEA